LSFGDSVKKYNKDNKVNPKSSHSGSAIRDVFADEQYKMKKGYVTGNSFRDSVEKFQYMEKMGYRLPNEPVLGRGEFSPSNTNKFSRSLSELGKFLGIKPKEKKQAKRGFWDRTFDLLSTGQYATAGFADALVSGKGVGTALKQAGQGAMAGLNVFSNERENEHEYNYSNVLGKAGWNPTTKGGKIAKGVVGFAGDVLLDPTTYLTLGTGALLKGTGKVGQKVLPKIDNLDDASKIVKKFYEQAPHLIKDNGKILEESARLLEKYKDLTGTKSRRGVELSIPFTNKSKTLISGDKIANFADKLGHTKYVNKATDAILSSSPIKLISNKAKLREMAKNDPQKLYELMKIDNLSRIRQGGKIDMREGQIKATKEMLESLSPQERTNVAHALIKLNDGSPEYDQIVRPLLEQTEEGKKILEGATRDLFGTFKASDRHELIGTIENHLKETLMAKGVNIDEYVKSDAFKYLSNYMKKSLRNTNNVQRKDVVNIVENGLKKALAENKEIPFEKEEIVNVMNKLKNQLDAKFNPRAKEIYEEFKQTGDATEILNVSRAKFVNELVNNYKISNKGATKEQLERVRQRLIREYDEKIEKITTDAIHTVEGAFEKLGTKEINAVRVLQREMRHLADEAMDMEKISKEKYDRMQEDFIEAFIETPSAKPNLPEIRKYFITEGYGFGAKQSKYFQMMQDEDYNKFKDAILSNKNFGDNLVDIYLKRVNSSLDVMYDTDTTEIFTKLFGSHLPKNGVLKKGNKAVVNIGMLKKYTLQVSRDRVRAKLGDKFNTLTREQVQLHMNIEQGKVAQELGFNPKDLNEFAKPFIELKPEQFKLVNKIDNLGAKQMDKYIVDKYNQQRNRQMMVDRNITLKLFDKFTQIMKLNVTATSPGFHVANKLGNMFNNFLAVKGEVFNPKTNMEAIKITKSAFTGSKVDGTFKSVYGVEYKLDDVLRWLHEDGVIDKSMFGVDLETGRKIAQDEDVSKGLLSKGLGLQKKYYKGDWEEFVKVEKNPNSINEQVDELSKWLAMNEVKKVYTNKELEDIILEFQSGVNRPRTLATKDGQKVNILNLFRARTNSFSATRGEKISYNIPNVKEDVPLVSWLRKNIGKIDPTDTQKFLPYTIAGNVGAHIETTDRVLHYIATLKQGGTREDAMESVNKFLFDYNDLTDFEFNVMRRIVPFYTWARKNTPLQLQQLFENTNTYKTVYKGMQIPEHMVEDEDKVDRGYLDWWNQDGVQLPFSTNSNKGFKENYLINNPLPMKDIVRFDPFNMEATGQKAFTQLHPLLRSAIELGTGKNVAFGNEIDSADKYAMNQIGTIKNYQNIFKGATDKSLTPTERLRLLNNELTGVKVNKANPDGKRRKELLDYFFNVLKPELEKQRLDYQSKLK
jgi:hypothetical protein